MNILEVIEKHARRIGSSKGKILVDWKCPAGNFHIWIDQILLTLLNYVHISKVLLFILYFEIFFYTTPTKKLQEHLETIQLCNHQ